MGSRFLITWPGYLSLITASQPGSQVFTSTSTTGRDLIDRQRQTETHPPPSLPSQVEYVQASSTSISSRGVSVLDGPGQTIKTVGGVGLVVRESPGPTEETAAPSQSQYSNFVTWVPSPRDIHRLQYG